MPDILVLYYSRGGSVAALARQVARGIGEVPGMQARLRTVPPVAPVTETSAPPVPDEGAPYASRADLDECVALALGSPTRFGNMAAPMKHFIDTLGSEWASGALVKDRLFAYGLVEYAKLDNDAFAGDFERKRESTPAGSCVTSEFWDLHTDQRKNNEKISDGVDRKKLCRCDVPLCEDSDDYWADHSRAVDHG